MHKFVIFLVMAATALHCCKLSSAQACTPDTSFTTIGPTPVSNKIFHVSSITKFDWFEAREHCKCHGYKLAHLDEMTGGEWTFLKGATNANFNNKWFWTGGRDRQSLVEQFVWDNDNVAFTPIDSSMENDFGAENLAFQSCLMYYASSVQPKLGPQNCGRKEHVAGILSQNM